MLQAAPAKLVPYSPESSTGDIRAVIDHDDGRSRRAAEHGLAKERETPAPFAHHQQAGTGIGPKPCPVVRSFPKWFVKAREQPCRFFRRAKRSEQRTVAVTGVSATPHQHF